MIDLYTERREITLYTERHGNIASLGCRIGLIMIGQLLVPLPLPRGHQERIRALEEALVGERARREVAEGAVQRHVNPITFVRDAPGALPFAELRPNSRSKRKKRMRQYLDYSISQIPQVPESRSVLGCIELINYAFRRMTLLFNITEYYNR